MMTLYTHHDWWRDGSFKAVAGQEIEEWIYDRMLNCMPPYRLPRNDKTDGFIGGFLMGEPYDFDRMTGKARYAAFGRRDGKFYFIGYMTK